MANSAAQSVRAIALQILQAVNEKGAYANLALDQALASSSLTAVDRHLVTTLVYGTLQYQNQIDWVIEQHATRPLAQMPSWIRNILRLGVYQLLHLDKIPPHAAVNESVKLARKHGHQGTVSFVNGILRNIARQEGKFNFPKLTEDPVRHIALTYAHPDWLIARWLEQYGIEETIVLCRANNTPPPVVVRTNTLKTTPVKLGEIFTAEGVRFRPGRWAPEALILEEFPPLRELRSFQEGLFQVQDESSMLVARLLAPQPGEMVLDTCSAPGGKTTHLAQLMQNQGQIIAVDVHQHKLDLVKANCCRLGVAIVETRLLDARHLAAHYAGQCDRVLIDAPCSGLGILRRKPDAKWQKSPEQLGELQRLQRQILQAGAACVKPGGTLVYSTCTLNPTENEGVIDWFLQANQSFTIDIPEGNWPLTGNYVYLLPHRHGTDGFFMARLKRKVKGHE